MILLSFFNFVILPLLFYKWKKYSEQLEKAVLPLSLSTHTRAFPPSLVTPLLKRGQAEVARAGMAGAAEVVAGWLNLDGLSAPAPLVAVIVR